MGGVLVIVLAVSLVVMAFAVVVVAVGVDAGNAVEEVGVVVLVTMRQSGLGKLLVFLHGIVQ